MIRTTLRAWGLSLLALLAASGGLAAFSAGSSTTSVVRMGVAAGILSVYAAVVALLTTPRSERTWLRCLLWGGAVPLGVGIATAFVAGAAGGAQTGLLSMLPWLAGVLAAVALGPWVPSLRLPRLPRRQPVDRYPL